MNFIGGRQEAVQQPDGLLKHRCFAAARPVGIAIDRLGGFFQPLPQTAKARQQIGQFFVEIIVPVRIGGYAGNADDGTVEVVSLLDQFLETQGALFQMAAVHLEAQGVRSCLQIQPKRRTILPGGGKGGEGFGIRKADKLEFLERHCAV